MRSSNPLYRQAEGLGLSIDSFLKRLLNSGDEIGNLTDESRFDLNKVCNGIAKGFTNLAEAIMPYPITTETVTTITTIVTNVKEPEVTGVVETTEVVTTNQDGVVTNTETINPSDVETLESTGFFKSKEPVKLSKVWNPEIKQLEDRVTE